MKEDGLMEKKYKQIFLGVAGCIVLYVGLINLSIVLEGAKHLLKMIFPIFVGLIIAFIINVPMKGIESLIIKVFAKSKYKPHGKILHVWGLALTLVAISLVMTLVWVAVIPQIVTSVTSLIDNIMTQMPVFIKELKNYNIDMQSFYDLIKGFDYHKVLGSMTNSLGSAVSYVVKFATSTVSTIGFVVMALVVSIYVLLSKESLYKSCKRVCYAYMKKGVADKIYYVSSLLNKTYSKFLSGQCLEAVILGVLMFVVLKIFRLPYAELTGVLAGICSFIPYIGAFLSCIVGALLMLLSGSERIITYVIVYLITQFVENQFIYPHVVGNSVGLPPIWILFSVVVGGELFGIIGMIFFIPFTAVVYTLLRDDVVKRLKDKKTKDRGEQKNA